MTLLGWIILGIVVYVIIAIIVGMARNNPLEGAFWIFFILGDILEIFSDIDF
jgi:hypothetical protein